MTTELERDRWFLGTFLRVVAGRDDTGGGLTVMEQLAPRDFSPPLHRHRDEDTALLVIDGELTVHVDGVESRLGPGEFAWLPRGVPHTFRVDSDQVRLYEFATPAGIEDFHVDASDPAPAREIPPPGEPDIPRVVAAAVDY